MGLPVCQQRTTTHQEASRNTPKDASFKTDLSSKAILGTVQINQFVNFVLLLLFLLMFILFLLLFLRFSMYFCFFLLFFIKCYFKAATFFHIFFLSNVSAIYIFLLMLDSVYAHGTD